MEKSILILLIILGLLKGFTFLRKPVKLKSGKYFILWSIPLVLLMVTILLMILNAAPIVIILILAAALIPETWIWMQEFRLPVKQPFTQLIPAIIILAVIAVIVVRIIQLYSRLTPPL